MPIVSSLHVVQLVDNNIQDVEFGLQEDLVELHHQIILQMLKTGYSSKHDAQISIPLDQFLV